MTVASVATQTSSQTSNAQKTLSENFDTFLVLLTAQLQNQDPLSPVDSNQFTEQLVSYSQVEQQIATNDKLAKLLESQNAANSNAAMSFIGRTATVAESTAELADGKALWGYELSEAAQSVKISILDSSGNVVATKVGSTNAGLNIVSWDGVGADGAQRESGKFKLRVEALDANGKAISGRITSEEEILGIDFSQSEPQYVTASGTYGFKDILALR